MPSNLFSQITEGIRINVRSAYVKDESFPRNLYFVFAYQVEIINESAYVVQLISRSWDIVDGLGVRRKVVGDGVVGKQPVIAPGETYRYVSGCHFPTPIGKMSGFYLMKRQTDHMELQIDIPPFTMMVPQLNN